MSSNINYQELKNKVQENDNPMLEPLRNLFAFMNYMDNEYQKDNDGKHSPYLEEFYQKQESKQK